MFTANFESVWGNTSSKKERMKAHSSVLLSDEKKYSQVNIVYVNENGLKTLIKS